MTGEFEDLFKKMAGRAKRFHGNAIPRSVFAPKEPKEEPEESSGSLSARDYQKAEDRHALNAGILRKRFGA